MFYKMFKPKTYHELKRAMMEVAASQTPTTTGRDIADDITSNVTFPATNNQATWDPTKTRADYEQKSEEIDEKETELRNNAIKFDGDEDWEIDCGLMATLVAEFGAGNCDDLASCALDYGMRTHSNCVLAFTQHDGFAHSFVLTYCKGDDEVWLADVWVKEHRSIKFTESLWCNKTALNCRVMMVKVDEAGTGVIEEWNKHNRKRRGKRPNFPSEYPRKDQCGAYRHVSAKIKQTGGLL